MNITKDDLKSIVRVDVFCSDEDCNEYLGHFPPYMEDDFLGKGIQCPECDCTSVRYSYGRYTPGGSEWQWQTKMWDEFVQWQINDGSMFSEIIKSEHITLRCLSLDVEA